MEKVLFFLAIVLLIPSVLGAVYINEIELNPPGSDNGDEWVEIYNNGPAQDLTGWYITDRDGNHFNFSSDVIGVGEFYVLDGLNGFVNTDERVRLYNSSDGLKDDSGDLSDTLNNNKTHQRIPDGTGAFVFQEFTKGITNIVNISITPLTITNKTSSPSCLFFDSTIILGADVNGTCIQDAIFSVEVDGNWTNFTGIEVSPGHYSVILPGGTFSQDGNFDWTVYARNCVNDVVKNGVRTLILNGKTSLSVNPPSPDGLNNWYISEPEFTLDNPDANDIWYHWDSDGVILYSGTFGLENIPNSPPMESAGILDLRWFSDVCAAERGVNESESTKMINVDLTNPVIEDLVPAHESVVANNQRPEISAHIDEIYNGNSGVNLSSVKILVDGIDVTSSANISVSGSVDAEIEYAPLSDLGVGEHNVTIIAFDNSGRHSQMVWTFEIVEIGEFYLNVYSPNDPAYGTKRVLFNITTTNSSGGLVEVEKIEYINYNEKNPKWKTLCKNCDDYVKQRTLLEGWNNLTIRASDAYGQVKEENRMFFIDSKKPQIHTMIPSKNDAVNGDFFYIKYTEDNLLKIELFWNSSKVLENCTSGKRQECFTSVNLSEHEGQEIEYWFEVSDGINNSTIHTTQSKKTKILVDTIDPVLTVNMPENGNYGRKVPFNISVSEDAALEYIDILSENPRWKSLCIKCDGVGDKKEKTISFKRGDHEIWTRATDKAGNTDTEIREFSVDY